MYYIDALNLLNLALENGILQAPQEPADHVLVIVERDEGEEWEALPKEMVIYEIMETKELQDLLISALKENGVEFQRFEGSAGDRFLEMAIKQTERRNQCE